MNFYDSLKQFVSLVKYWFTLSKLGTVVEALKEFCMLQAQLNLLLL